MEHWHLWTIAGILLLILEMLIFSFFAASFAAAAFVTALVALNAPDLTVELAAFTISSAVAVVAVRPVLSRLLYRRSDNRPVLVAALIGQNGTVVDEIEARGGHGRVRTGGEEWRALACDARHIPAGTRVEIIAVSGSTLTVKPA